MTQFKATIDLDGKTATGIAVPAEVVDGLGGGKRPPVTVAINGYSYKSTVASMGGVYKVPISAENRQAAGVQAGDTVTVDIEIDTAPREVEVPADFASALNTDTTAKAFFETLSNSKKKAFTYWIETAKQAETRQNRINQAVEMLHNQQSR